jgi:hypothetical protein
LNGPGRKFFIVIRVFLNLQVNGIKPLTLENCPKPGAFHGCHAKTPAALFADIAKLYTRPPSAKHSAVLAQDLCRRGVVIDQEFEFAVCIRDGDNQLVPIPYETALSVDVSVNYGGIVKPMPHTVRESAEKPGVYFVRSICQKGTVPTDAVTVSVSVSLSGLLITAEPLSITAVR